MNPLRNSVATPSACFQCVVILTCFFSPLFQSKAIKPFGVTSIPHVFLSGCPMTICRSVISIIVNAVYLVFWTWPRSNIFIKRQKRKLPFFANFYPATAIIRKRGMFFVVTSAFHRCPSTPFSSSGHSVCRIAL